MIRLKIKDFSKLELLTEALKHFTTQSPKINATVLHKIQYSIANEYYYKLFKKVNNPYPPKTTTLKMAYHIAATLNAAILKYQDQFFATDLKHAQLETLKYELGPKL